MASTPQLDKLLEIAAVENKLSKRELFIHGQDLTFWSKPTTIADFQLAKKSSKNPDDFLEYTVRLFVSKALDEGGQRQYESDAIPVLMRQLSMKTATALMSALNPEEDEEEEALDMKSPQEAAKGKK
ncbi:MAG: hypothetical protein CMA72_06055 [Euryarchaeota archaeon]|nr:hypothetical protein [Euryarchaeota archaeon]|tara:strand:+ start:8777 stop:9157 length:381 start_codon:yes stop_codon:yes gene_type:complete